MLLFSYEALKICTYVCENFSQPLEPFTHRSSSPLRVVSDPRRKTGKESDSSSEKVRIMAELQESPHEESSAVSQYIFLSLCIKGAHT